MYGSVSRKSLSDGQQMCGILVRNFAAGGNQRSVGEAAREDPIPTMNTRR